MTDAVALAGEALHTCTLIDRRDGGEPLYRCDGCGQHLLGLHFMQLHRAWEEIKHLRAERDHARELIRHLDDCVKRGGPSNYRQFLPKHLQPIASAALDDVP